METTDTRAATGSADGATGSRAGDLEPLLRDVCRAMSGATRRLTVSHGISPAALWCLSLCAERGDLTVSALSERAGVTPGTVSRVLDGLEARGLVSRRRSPDDRRIVTVRATEAGRRLIQEVTGHRRRVLAQAVSRVPDGDLKAFARVLAAVRDSLPAACRSLPGDGRPPR